jgi:hypothetical protein
MLTVLFPAIAVTELVIEKDADRLKLADVNDTDGGYSGYAWLLASTTDTATVNAVSGA